MSYQSILQSQASLDLEQVIWKNAKWCDPIYPRPDDWTAMLSPLRRVEDLFLPPDQHGPFGAFWMLRELFRVRQPGFLG